jgi:hypothetical protein
MNKETFSAGENDTKFIRICTYENGPNNFFRIRTCRSLSKQTTYKPIRIRTYEHQIY